MVCDCDRFMESYVQDYMEKLPEHELMAINPNDIPVPFSNRTRTQVQLIDQLMTLAAAIDLHQNIPFDQDILFGPVE